jgi:hypothetical protein
MSNRAALPSGLRCSSDRGAPVSDPNYVDFISTVGSVISHPLKAVWPRLLDQAAWMREFKIENVSGERSQEGELKRVSALSGQPEFPHFFFKTLRLVPFERYVYKAFSAARGGAFAFTGIEILSLSAVDNRTAVTFEAYLEVQSATMTAVELEQFVCDTRRDSAAMWHRNFERLSSMVAGETSASTV